LRTTRFALSSATAAAGLVTPPALMWCVDGGLNALVAGSGDELMVVVTRTFALKLTPAEQEAALASLLVRTQGSVPGDFDADEQIALPPHIRIGHVIEYYTRADHMALKTTFNPDALLSALRKAAELSRSTWMPHVRMADALALWAWPWAERVSSDDAHAATSGDTERWEYYRTQGHRPELERIASLSEIAGAAAAATERSHSRQDVELFENDLPDNFG
jgi:hypothetical protein